jgi:nucleotide-binding universal stress UspA family protein
MGQVVVGVDGSELSRRALRWGAAVARAQGHGVQALMAWQYPPHTGTPVGPAVVSPEEMDRDTEAELRAIIAAELGEAADDVVVEVGRGRPGDVLLARSGRPDAALLVLGARGLGGFDGMLLGSVTQQCVERAPCPVVVIRGEDDAAAIPPAKLLVALDGSAGAARALAWAIDLAAATRAEIVAAHVPGVAPSRAQHDAAAAQLEGDWTAPLRERGLPHRTRVDDGDPRTMLPQVAQEEGADLVVMGTRGVGGVRALLVGSVAAYLVRYAEEPIAVVPGG